MKQPSHLLINNKRIKKIRLILIWHVKKTLPWIRTSSGAKREQFVAKYRPTL